MYLSYLFDGQTNKQTHKKTHTQAYTYIPANSGILMQSVEELYNKKQVVAFRLS